MKTLTLKFFLPFEFDQVPKKWDPWEDTWEKKGGRKFIWDFYQQSPYDGLLISKSKFDDNKKRFINKKEGDKNLKILLGIEENIELFGDCGAFQYRNDEKPPYQTREILDYYQNYGFDMGCSIDHIITDKKDKELREKRYKITKEFAKDCLEKYQEGDYTFELFGVAQGWNIKSYLDISQYLYELGYENLCLGGLVGLKTKSKNPREFTLIKLIHALKDFLKKYSFKKVHVFGRGNVSLFDHYKDSGITQFDNNIMRKAWTDEKRSYHLFMKKTDEMKYYTSIRIPLIKNAQGKQKEEFKIFESLSNLSQKRISNNDFINDLKNYYDVYKKIHSNKSFKINQDLLSDLLKDQPWIECECDICKKFGIHIVVFRRRMRNTLRAFHNVYNYYSYLKTKRNSSISRISETNLTDFT